VAVQVAVLLDIQVAVEQAVYAAQLQQQAAAAL
jgi:hypothetical protein